MELKYVTKIEIKTLLPKRFGKKINDERLEIREEGAGGEKKEAPWVRRPPYIDKMFSGAALFLR